MKNKERYAPSSRRLNSDIWIAAAFVVLITLQPYFLHGKINLFELGIYLPNIHALHHGQVPYRDFFYLRGPFELYVPAWVMMVFGQEVSVLMAYFYAGSVLTLILFVFLGRKILSTRFFFYLMILVLVARTFPRVVFTYWGGWRFGVGALAILFAAMYFYRKDKRWLVAAGVASACAALTSIEIGACALVGVTVALLAFAVYHGREDRKNFLFDGAFYAAGWLVIIIPYGIYLALHQAWGPYVDALWAVVTNMENTFPVAPTSRVPQDVGEALIAMVNPAHKNFKHMTPAYGYIFAIGYLIVQLRRRQMNPAKFTAIALAGYGLVLYGAAFRNIEASQFEMALQPEKILLFFILEEAYLWWRPHQLRYARMGMILVLLSSMGYAMQRYNHRFFAFQYLRNTLLCRPTLLLQPLANEERVMLGLNRVKGLVIPKEQAEDFIQVSRFLQERTSAGEPVLMFPELGAYSFIIDRPFVGRFATATFAWISDRWHKEFLAGLRLRPARFAVVQRELSHWFQETYFKVPTNKEKYEEVLGFIQEYYTLVHSTPSLDIYTYRHTPSMDI